MEPVLKQMTVKLLKNKGKEKHLNLTREMKMYNLQGRIIKLMADSSMEMMETKKNEENIYLKF